MRRSVPVASEEDHGTGFVVPILIIHRVFPEMKERSMEER